MRLVRLLLALALAAAAILAATDAACAEGKPVRREPWVGYVYPAGGQRGTTVRITAGGQNLQGVTGAFLTGDGVRAKVVQYMRPLSLQQLGELRRQLENIRDARAAKAAGKVPPAPRPKPDDRIQLPDLPPFDRLADLTTSELQDVAAKYLGAAGKRQPNAQIGETVEIDVEIDASAPAGDREVRLRTPLGLTNPLRFQVGAFPEATEVESAGLPRALPLLEVPAVLNGQVFPGDLDAFRFRARKSQRLVVRVEARSLVPFLADAVPGWFQAVVAVRDAAGHELAYDDDWRFDPDPVLLFRPPADGEYRVEIHDSIWRGREDFVYRITVSEAPFVTRMYPLGVHEGETRDAQIAGWNLSDGRLPLDGAGAGDEVRVTAVRRGAASSNALPYAVDDLPETDEAEPNDAPAKAQELPTPRVVNGRIDRPGDADVFTILGTAGEEVVAEVIARRLGSPLDPVLRLTDANGAVVAWNDDFDDGAPGIATHHADSYLRAKLPATGAYRLRVADAQGHGGPDHAYRLRVGPPRPDFQVVVTPSSLNVVPGSSVVLSAHVVRRDGFDGDVLVTLDPAQTGLPDGLVLSGRRIPAGRSDVRMTLTVPASAPDDPFPLRLVAGAHVGGANVTHDVVPAEDRMQAFAYRHLVPSQELLVATVGLPRRAPPAPPSPAVASFVRIPVGGAATADLLVPNLARAVRGADLAFELDDPPPGVTLEKWTLLPEGLALTLRATEGQAAPGPADNLIVEIVAQFPDRRDGKRASGDGVRRVSLGWLPAIPFEIVGR